MQKEEESGHSKQKLSSQSAGKVVKWYHNKVHEHLMTMTMTMSIKTVHLISNKWHVINNIYEIFKLH